MGALAAKAAMQTHGITGTIRFMGEPAEKVRGSKPIHAAKGYYDGLDAIISFHPFYMLPLCNTARWDTHCGPYYAAIYEFLCESPETWLQGCRDGCRRVRPFPPRTPSARAPGANDAVVAMYTLSKMMRDHMLPHTGTWTLNETILASGQATADNLAAQMAMIMFAARAPDAAMLKKIYAVLDRNAEAAAAAAHCTVKRHWVSKSKPGLANHAMAEITFRNLERAGAPRYGAEAVAKAQALQTELGLEPMAQPFADELGQLVPPQEAERRLRLQISRLADALHLRRLHGHDVVCAHRALLCRARRAEGAAGICLSRMGAECAGRHSRLHRPDGRDGGKTIAATILDLMTDRDTLARAKAEFADRKEKAVRPGALVRL